MPRTQRYRRPGEAGDPLLGPARPEGTSRDRSSLAGTRLGPYEVVERIGEGGVGIVVRARAPTGRAVAIKVLKSALSDTAVIRFKRERRLLVFLGELEGFVPIVDDGVSSIGPYLVMPYLGGGTLGDRVKRGPLDIEATVRLGIALATATGRAHERGIVHRDLKPENVIFTLDGRPLIADLGFAKHFRHNVLEGDRSVSLSLEGDFLGTPAYMAPEQMQDAKAVGPPADVYALGAILYECLAGRAAIRGKSVLEIIDKVAKGDVERVEKLRPQTPPWLASVLATALARNPWERYADARALARALELDEQGRRRAEASERAIARAGSAFPAPGRRIGDYNVLSELGRGASGIVLRARAPEGGDVAIKVLHRIGPQPLARFERERRILELMGEADGFVPLLGAGTVQAAPYLVMPLVPGGTLRDRLEKGPLGVDETARIGLALARALGRAHGRGVVHRDMKPENVLFTEDGRPLVADLGLAKHFPTHLPGDRRSLSLSLSGAFLGTAGYMAPEQMLDAKSIGPPADVFALGAILYEALTGVGPFSGESLAEIVSNVEKAEVAPLRKLCPDVPRWLERVIARALSRDPKKRFEDGAALSRALENGALPVHRRSVVRAVVIGLLAAAGGGIAALALASADRREGAAATEAPPGDSPPGAVSVQLLARPEPRARDLPASCRAFQTTATTRLVSVWGSLRGKHSEEVRAVAFSPDGRHALSGGMDRSLRVWDVSTGEELATLEGHRGSVVSLAFSPDGRRALSGSEDGTVMLWAPPSSSPALTLVARGGAVHQAAFSPDGKTCLAGYDDGTLRLWDLATGDELRTLHLRGSAVRSVSFARDGALAVAGGLDGRIAVYDLSTGERVRELTGHGGAVHAVLALPDRRHALSAGDDETIGLWDIQEGTLVRALTGHTGPVLSLALSSNGACAVSGSADRTVRTWDLNAALLGATERVPLRTLRGHTDRVHGVAFSPDGRRVLSGSTDQSVRLWDLATGSELLVPAGHRGRVYSIALAPGGQRVLTGSQDGTMKLWDVPSGREVASFPVHESACAVAFTPDGRVALSGSWDDALRARDLASGALLDAQRGHAGGVQAIACSADGRIVTASEDRTLKVWELTGSAGDVARELHEGLTLKGHARGVDSLALSRDGRLAVSGSEDGAIKVWDLAQGVERRTLAGHRGRVHSVALSLDRRRVLSGSWDGTVRLWDLATGEARTLEAGRHVVSFVAFLPGGRRALAAGFDRTIRILDLEDGALVDRIDLSSTTDHATCGAVSGDGRSLFVGTARGLVLRFELGDAGRPQMR